MAPILDPALTDRLEEALRVELQDDVLAWELGPYAWAKVPVDVGVNAHEQLQELALARAGWPR
jgi:hypothetical protein